MNPSLPSSISVSLKKTLSRFSEPFWLAVVAGILLLGYAIFIGMNFAPVAAGADSGGYFNSAKLLAAGKLTESLRVVPESNAAAQASSIALGYVNDLGTLILRPAYPVGLPMHYAAAAKMMGWHWGPMAVGVGGTVLAVVLCFFCLREFGVGRALSFAGAVSLAVSPMLLFISFVPMGDALSMMWCTAAVLGALRARRSITWSLACGFAFSVAVLVRPSCIVLGPSLVLILWNWRNLLGGVVGGLPGAIWAAFYNRIMYGSPFRTGYGSILDAFMWSSVAPSFKNYLSTFPHVLPLIIPALLLTPLLPWRHSWRELSAAFLWWIGLIVFYSFYDITQLAWWYLRFVLPAFPLIVVCGVLGIEELLKRFAARERTYVAVAALVIFVSSLTSVRYNRERHVMLMKSYQLPYEAVCDWTRANLPSDTLIACMQTSSAIYFYTQFPIIRWDQIASGDFAELAKSLQRTKRPFYATLFPFEEEDAVKRLTPGAWKKIADVKGIGIWRFTPPD